MSYVIVQCTAVDDYGGYDDVFFIHFLCDLMCLDFYQ